MPFELSSCEVWTQIKQKRRKALQLFKKLCVIPTQKHVHSFQKKTIKTPQKWKQGRFLSAIQLWFSSLSFSDSLNLSFPKFLLRSIERSLPSFHWISRTYPSQAKVSINSTLQWWVLLAFMFFAFMFFAFCFLLFSINSCLVWCMIKAGENLMA